MIIVLTEDTGSGADLWRHWLTYSNKRHDVISFQGNKDLTTKLFKILKQLKNNSSDSSQLKLSDGSFWNMRSTDTILVVSCDTLSATYSEYVEEYVEALRRFGIHTVLSQYGCIEECFLSFKFLTEWIASRKSKNDTIVKTIEILQQLIRLQEPIYDRLDEHGNITLKQELQELVNDVKFTTSERYFSAILSTFTHGTGFGISKGTVGPCWKLDCCWEVQEYNKMEVRCTLFSSSPTALMKLKELVEYSNLRCCFSDGKSELSLLEVCSIA